MLRLKELMDEKGISGKELADKIGVTPSAISNIRKGRNYPGWEQMASIAKALDVDIRELLIPTKADDTETLYVKREGQYTPIGKIKRE